MACGGCTSAVSRWGNCVYLVFWNDLLFERDLQVVMMSDLAEKIKEEYNQCQVLFQSD